MVDFDFSPPNETVFTMETTPLKFGAGATAEVGYDLRRLGVRRPLLVTDHGLMRTGLPDKVCHVLRKAGLAADLYDKWEDGRIKLFLTQAALHARRENPEVIVLAHGGPISSAEDTRYLYQHTDAQGTPHP